MGSGAATARPWRAPRAPRPERPRPPPLALVCAEALALKDAPNVLQFLRSLPRTASWLEILETRRRYREGIANGDSHRAARTHAARRMGCDGRTVEARLAVPLPPGCDGE